MNWKGDRIKLAENLVSLRLPPDWLAAVNKEFSKRLKKEPKLTKQRIILERLAESYGISSDPTKPGRPWPDREEPEKA